MTQNNLCPACDMAGMTVSLDFFGTCEQCQYPKTITEKQEG